MTISTEESQVQSGYSMDFINVFTTEEIFHSRDALVNWARDVGKRNGSVIVIKINACISEILHQTGPSLHVHS
ncbi:hypothetical protein AAC387_Pa07g0400 [Persea americana]